MTLRDMFSRRSNSSVESCYVNERGELILGWFERPVSGVIGPSDDPARSVLFWLTQ